MYESFLKRMKTYSNSKLQDKKKLGTVSKKTIIPTRQKVSIYNKHVLCNCAHFMEQEGIGKATKGHSGGLGPKCNFPPYSSSRLLCVALENIA